MLKQWNWRDQMIIIEYIKQNKGENQMNKRLFLWITFGLLVVLLAACGAAGAKSEVKNCKGTLNLNASPSAKGWNDGPNFAVDVLWVMNLKSDCPELTGVMEVTENTSTGGPGIGSNYTSWGIFRFETAYEGGGVVQGTYNGVMKESRYNNVLTSHAATGSLSGLQVIFRTIDLPVNTPTGNFEATIEKTP